MREMSAFFNAELDEGDGATTITMDNKQAKGFISSYRIFSGLEVWVYNIKFHTDFKIDLLTFLIMSKDIFYIGLVIKKNLQNSFRIKM